MPRPLMIECPEHGSVDIGYPLDDGQTVTMEGSKALCHAGQHWIPIPDGTYTNGPFGVVHKP